MCRGTMTRMTSDFLSDKAMLEDPRVKTSRYWKKKRKPQPVILYPAKVAFRNK